MFRFFLASAPKEPLTDQSEIDRRYRLWGWVMFLCITIGYSFFYTTRLSFSVAKKSLLDSGVLNSNQMGQIGSALLFSYAFGKCFNGFLADRLHLGRFMGIGLLVSALINFGFGASESFALFMGLWAINGIAQSLGAPVSGVTMAAWYKSNERGVRYSVWSLAHDIGEGMTFWGTASVVASYGWRSGFYVPAAACTLVAVTLFLVMKDRPVAMGLPAREEQDEKLEALTVGELQRMVLKNWRVWILALASACMYVQRYAINSWGMLYLQLEKGYSEVQAGSVVGLRSMVGGLGTVSSGIISDKLFGGRRSPATLGYGLLLLVALGLVLFGPAESPLLVKIGMAGTGFATGGLLVFLGGLTALDICPRRAAGAALGLVGVMSYLGAGVQDVVSGMLIHASKVETGQYDFTSAKYVWMGAAAVSLVLAMTLWRQEKRA